MTSYRMSLIRHQRRTFLLCKKIGMQKWTRLLIKSGKAVADSSAMRTQRREDSDSCSLLPLMIVCWRILLVITKHPEDGPVSPNAQHHKQIDYVPLRRRFLSGLNIAKTQSFPEADIESDHDLLMMTFHLRPKKIGKSKDTRLKFDLEKLKDPNVLETFQAMIGGLFAALTIVNDADKDMASMTSTQQ